MTSPSPLFLGRQYGPYSHIGHVGSRCVLKAVYLRWEPTWLLGEWTCNLLFSCLIPNSLFFVDINVKHYASQGTMWNNNVVCMFLLFLHICYSLKPYWRHFKLNYFSQLPTIYVYPNIYTSVVPIATLVCSLSSCVCRTSLCRMCLVTLYINWSHVFILLILTCKSLGWKQHLLNGLMQFLLSPRFNGMLHHLRCMIQNYVVIVFTRLFPHFLPKGVFSVLLSVWTFPLEVIDSPPLPQIMCQWSVNKHFMKKYSNKLVNMTNMMTSKTRKRERQTYSEIDR